MNAFLNELPLRVAVEPVKFIALINKHPVDLRVIDEKAGCPLIGHVADEAFGEMMFQIADQGCREQHIPDAEGVDDEDFLGRKESTTHTGIEDDPASDNAFD